MALVLNELIMASVPLMLFYFWPTRSFCDVNDLHVLIAVMVEGDGVAEAGVGRVPVYLGLSRVHVKCINTRKRQQYEKDEWKRPS